MIERDNVYDNRVAGLDSPSRTAKNPPLRFIVFVIRRALHCVSRCACPHSVPVGDIVQKPRRVHQDVSEPTCLPIAAGMPAILQI